MIPLKRPSKKGGRGGRKEKRKKSLFPKQSVCHQFAVALFSQAPFRFASMCSCHWAFGRPGPQTHKPEEISVPCQPTASADGMDAFSLLPVDSPSLIFHTKVPAAGLLILFYLSFWHLLLRPIKFDVWLLTVGGTVVSVHHASGPGELGGRFISRQSELSPSVIPLHSPFFLKPASRHSPQVPKPALLFTCVVSHLDIHWVNV